jgi:hypothetical protein
VNPKWHNEFVALCALFPSGGLTEEEWALLQVHLAYCDSCRVVFHHYEHLADNVMPVVAAIAYSDPEFKPETSSFPLDEAEQGLMSQLNRSPTDCDVCGQSTAGYDIVHYGSIERGYRRLCSRCFNTQMAKAAGLEGFEHAKFEPMGLTDCLGVLHEFHFRVHLFGTGVAIDAFELRNEDPAGYSFQIIGEPEVDLLVLLGRLVEKMRRALSIKHLKDGDYGLQIADGGVVRGRIKWDDAHDGQLPLLVIDGREIEWDQFGRMLMSYEGAQFKLTIADKSEEL